MWQVGSSVDRKYLAIMFKFGFAFTAIIGVISAQDCKERPLIVQNGEPCCKIGDCELGDALKECGIKPDGYNKPTCEIVDCAFDKLKLMKDGKLDLDAIATFFDQEVTKLPDYKNVFLKSKESCVKDLSGAATEIPCDSVKMLLCVQRFFISECPAESWNNSDECNKVKETVEKCSSPF